MKRIVRPIELLYYPEYEPADSDSEGEESVDEEPDSEDEWAIDDGDASDVGEGESGLVPPAEPVVEEPGDSTTVRGSETPPASGELVRP